MNAGDFEEHLIRCPFCREAITIFVDPTVSGDEYTEDCTVCCRPILIRVDRESPGERAQIRIDREYDA
jgi:hypothetical protein